MRALSVAFACLPLASCNFYSADAISARVVDAETLKPLEGVNVVAAWKVKGGLEGGNVVGYTNVLEAVTTKDGVFTFPSWGPRLNMYFGRVRLEAPQLLFFKSGYRFYTVTNHGDSLSRAAIRNAFGLERQDDIASAL